MKAVTEATRENDGMGVVLYQLIREMGFPFLIAAGWTIYSLWTAPSKRNVVDSATIFGGSFFFACWAFAQWFRVKKQQAVESGLVGIVEKQDALVTKLIEATERLEGHASGGKSIGWLMLASPCDGFIRNITAHVDGAFTLIDAKASVLDLSKSCLGTEEYRRTGNTQDFFKHHVNFNCGTLQPKLAIIQDPVVPCDTTQPFIRFKVDWTARNGKWTQYVELKRNDNRYDFYTAVNREGNWVYENPQRDSIPKRSNGTPDVFWLTSVEYAFSGT